MINSVLKAIDVIELFSTEEPRLQLTEISGRLGIPKSTTYNLLNTMRHRGYVEKADDGRYALGTAFIPLTQAIRINVELRDRTAPLLRRLADASGESVYLTVRDDDYCLYIYAIESSSRLLARTVVGDRVLMHCTSVGKSILAALPDDEVIALAERVGLPAYTDNTITDIDYLLQHLAETRARGYATDRGEHERGLYCIGAPILDGRGKVVASCSISGVDKDILRVRRDDLVPLVMDTCQEASRRMGYVPDRLSSLNIISR